MTFVVTGGAFLEYCNKVGGINTPSTQCCMGLNTWRQYSAISIVQFIPKRSFTIRSLLFLFPVGDRAKDPNIIVFTFLPRYPTFSTSTCSSSLVSMAFEDALAGLPSLGQSYVRLPRRGPSRVSVHRIVAVLHGDRSDRSL